MKFKVRVDDAITLLIEADNFGHALKIAETELKSRKITEIKIVKDEDERNVDVTRIKDEATELLNLLVNSSLFQTIKSSLEKIAKSSEEKACQCAGKCGQVLKQAAQQCDKIAGTDQK